MASAMANSVLCACARDDNDPNTITRRLVKSNNFTGQTNAVDVDKHMSVPNLGL